MRWKYITCSLTLGSSYLDSVPWKKEGLLDGLPPKVEHLRSSGVSNGWCTGGCWLVLAQLEGYNCFHRYYMIHVELKSKGKQKARVSVSPGMLLIVTKMNKNSTRSKSPFEPQLPKP